MRQFKATVWPKVASESTYEVQKFSGGASPRPPYFLLHPYCKRLSRGGGAGYKVTRKRSVPTLYPGIGCVLATPLATTCMSRVLEASMSTVKIVKK